MADRPAEDRRDAVEARELCRWAGRVGRGTRGGPRAGGALGVGSGSLPLPAFVMLTLFGAYRFRIRNPVIASGAKPIQSARKPLWIASPGFRRRRNDEVRRPTDGKGYAPKKCRVKRDKEAVG